jgi:hypothetical protein
MPFCPDCGTRQSENARFCESCGAPMSGVPANAPVHPPTLPIPTSGVTLVCPSCGAQLEVDSLFCDMCGVRLNAAVPSGGASRPPTRLDLPVGMPTDASPPPPPRPANAGATAVVDNRVSAAPTLPQARLIIQTTQATLHLPYGKAEIIVGRDDPVGNLFPDIDLTDCGGDKAGVSRQHARIFFQGAQAFIEDRNSTNHTYVNGEELTPWQPHLLQSGDEIKFGRLAADFFI